MSVARIASISTDFKYRGPPLCLPLACSMVDWTLAVNGESVFPIDPLR